MIATVERVLGAPARALLLVAATVLAAGACGSSGDPTPATSTSNAPAATQAATTSSATDVAQVPGVTIDQWSKATQDNGNVVYIFGEVVNNSDEDVSIEKIVVIAEAAGGDELESKDDLDVLPLIHPNGKAVFTEPFFDLDPSKIAGASFQIVAYPATAPQARSNGTTTDLTVDSIKWTNNSISGSVHNNTPNKVTQVQVQVAGYDAQGKLVAVENNLTSMVTLGPSASSDFNIGTWFLYDMIPPTVVTYAYGY